MEVDDADDSLRCGIDDHDGSDFSFFHEVERFAGKQLRRDGLRRAHHAVARGHGERGATVFFHQAAKVAIGEDAGEFAIGGKNGGHTEFFG